MRRTLVLTNEAARHPFRQMIPVERTPLPEPAAKPVAVRQSDLAFFSISFVGFFVVIMAMTL